jgi:hypothetical protein
MAMPLALIVCLAGSGRIINAEEEMPTGPGHSLTSSARPRLFDVQRQLPAVEGLPAVTQSAPRASSRDTLKNGALIGAIAGAAGLGLVGGLICHLYQEEGGASCWSDTLRLAAIGAAIGTGAGITVDAALTRHPGVAVRVGVTF